jgi:hypothetical protein
VAGFCEHGNELSGSMKKDYCLTSCVTISFSNNILHHGVSNSHWISELSSFRLMGTRGSFPGGKVAGA